MIRHWVLDTTYTGHLWVLETGFPGAQTLCTDVGGVIWDHLGVWVCVKAVVAQGFISKTGVCKRETLLRPSSGAWTNRSALGKCLSCVTEHAPQGGTPLHYIALLLAKRPESCAQVDIFTTLCLSFKVCLHLWNSIQVYEALQHAFIYMLTGD